MRVRDARADEEGFLWRMLVVAAYRPGTPPPPDPDDEVRRYLDGWGRDGDVALIAQAGDEPVGAGWFRRFPEDRPGYGFVAGDVPELALAVEPAWRGRGVGTRLLAGLIERASALGLRGLSLSVSLENPAQRLYRRHGFEPVRQEGGSVTMFRNLRASRR